MIEGDLKKRVEDLFFSLENFKKKDQLIIDGIKLFQNLKRKSSSLDNSSHDYKIYHRLKRKYNEYSGYDKLGYEKALDFLLKVLNGEYILEKNENGKFKALKIFKSLLNQYPKKRIFKKDWLEKKLFNEVNYFSLYEKFDDFSYELDFDK